MGSSYTKMAMFGFLFSALVTGVMSSNISSCYKVDQSWTNSTLLDVLTSVPDYEECQALCRDKAGCEGWTWTDEENSALRNHCLLYSDFGRTLSYPHCVSGPPSCLCSKPEQCEITEDNELDVVPYVAEEYLCQEMCATTSANSLGLIISGGDDSDKSVELYSPSTGQHCQLPDLPDRREGHSMEKKMICGGYYNPTSCLTLSSSGWETTTDLLEGRRDHTSWASPSGIVLMGGGGSTTEKIQEDGTSTYSFDLRYTTDDACAINLGSSVIITGGYYTRTIV